jgi:hypothetical protein
MRAPAPALLLAFFAIYSLWPFLQASNQTPRFRREAAISTANVAEFASFLSLLRFSVDIE